MIPEIPEDKLDIEMPYGIGKTTLRKMLAKPKENDYYIHPTTQEFIIFNKGKWGKFNK